MTEKITNRLAFNIYVWINFCLTCSVMVFFSIFLLENILNKKIPAHNSEMFGSILVILIVLYVILWGVNFLIKPSYLEAEISFGQIKIHSFNPNRRNGFSFFLMLFYRKSLKEHIIERKSYNDYRIVIGRLGIVKSMVLQKTENGILYESSPISIGFLAVRKYTNLILAIDRLKGKFSLN